MADETPSPDTLTLTAEIVASYLGANAHVKADEIPEIIRSVRQALSETGEPATPEAPAAVPKMHGSSVKKSITPDALISFIDNKPYKTLKRHLSRHGHDMKSYREAYGLPNDYPSVAPNYSAARSEMAKKLGLGAQRRKAATPQEGVEPTKAPSGRGRKKVSEPA